MKRTVAIKFVRRGRARDQIRLLREARALQALKSDYAVRVFDLGMYDDAPYVVMELLDGVDLGDLVAAEGPLSVEAAVDAVVEAGAALVEAHRHGIVHRDVKPSNLFLCTALGRRRVKLLDFGISKLAPELRDDDLEQTADGSTLGTPYYMSPEQFRNSAKTDARTDVWSLAVTLYYLLTGRYPFPGETSGEVTAAILTEAPRPLGDGFPEGIATAIRRALVRRPEERTPSVAQLMEALVAFGSKRAQDAAEVIETIGHRVPVPSPDPAFHAVTTEDAISTARPTTGSSEEVASPSIPKHRASRGWWIGGLALLGSIAWFAAFPGSSPAVRAKSMSLPSLPMPSALPAAKTASSAETMPPPAPVAPSAAPQGERPEPSRPRPAVVVPTPPPSASSPSPAPAAVDIDGVPIVE